MEAVTLFVAGAVLLMTPEVIKLVCMAADALRRKLKKVLATSKES
jgi:hypothetical protein